MVRDIVIILIILIGGYFYIRRFYRIALLQYSVNSYVID